MRLDENRKKKIGKKFVYNENPFNLCDVRLLNTFIDILTYPTETATAIQRRAPVPYTFVP